MGKSVTGRSRQERGLLGRSLLGGCCRESCGFEQVRAALLQFFAWKNLSSHAYVRH